MRRADRQSAANPVRNVDPGDAIRVLLVEDNLALARVVARFLDAGGFVVDDLASGDEALPAAPIGGYGLVLLDLSRPAADGSDVLASIRKASDLPVIVLSRPANDGQRVVAFRLDADKLPKPLSPRDLRARIRAVLRRAGVLGTTHLLHFGELTVDPALRTVEMAGMDCDLTRREFDLFAYLVAAEGRVCPRRELLSEVWASSPEWQDADTVTEHVRRIRRKLSPSGAHLSEGWIRTMRGVGYRFDPTGGRRTAATVVAHSRRAS